MLIARVTSVLHKEAADLTVNDWTGAGLLKPSIVRRWNQTMRLSE